MNDCAFGQETGRTFIYDDRNTMLVLSEPDHDDWHRWIEFKGSDGEFTYVSDDPDGYWLDSEEFGPFNEDEVIWNAYNYATHELVPMEDAIECAPYGRWYIKMNYAGYNSTANNCDGYATDRLAINAIRRYQRRGV